MWSHLGHGAWAQQQLYGVAPYSACLLLLIIVELIYYTTTTLILGMIEVGIGI